MAAERQHALQQEQLTVFIEPNEKDVRMGRRKTCFLRAFLVAAVMTIVSLAVAVGGVYRHQRRVAEPVKANPTPPNIVFILVDDLGFNDVSWNNPDVKMPRLDAMARNGVILDQNYMQPVCSPSRGSIMTGMYAHHIGLQHGAILPNSPECATRDHTFLPEKLREYGYTNHMVGKWHLGFCNWECTPTYRGFDTFYGFYQNRGDHYNHTVDGGYDWRDGTEVDWNARGTYSTDLITNRAIELINHHDPQDPMFLYLSYAAVHTPLAAPERFMNMHKDYKNPYRRMFLAMVSALDESIGLVMDSLRGRNMMQNTVVVFTSDNGGQMYMGSNAPLRGAKSSVYEGGTRVPGFVYGRTVSRQGEINNGLMHVSDWFPTLVALAGGSTDGMNIDGIDQTALFFGSGVSNRAEIIYNIDVYELPVFGAFAIRRGDFKLIMGFPGVVDGWEQDGNLGFTHDVDVIHQGAGTRFSLRVSTFTIDYTAVQDYIDTLGNHVQLYNVRVDPSERVNLAHRHPGIVEDLRNRLTEAMQTSYDIDLESQLPDPAGNADNFGGAWSPGWC